MSERLVPRQPPDNRIFAPPGIPPCREGEACRWPQICGEHRCIESECGDSPNFDLFLRTPEAGYIPEDVAIGEMGRAIGLRLLAAAGKVSKVGIAVAIAIIGYIAIAWAIWEVLHHG